MSNQFIIPRPRDWEVFEDLVADLLRREYGTFNLLRHGRSGQIQSGVDIVGPTKLGILGVQCKHTNKIPLSIIKTEIDKAEGFSPPLCELVIVTSANRDTKTLQGVMKLSEARKREGKWPVSIFFWEDVIDRLQGFPDLTYKHITKYFSFGDYEHIKLPKLTAKQQTILWPSDTKSIRETIVKNLGGIESTDPYQFTLGITSFPDVRFTGLVDIEVQLELPPAEESTLENFFKHANTLDELKATISDFGSNQSLLVYLQSRITVGFLFGWIFRHTTNFSLQFISGDELWPTEGLPEISSGLYEARPVLLNDSSKEIALVLSLSRDIGDKVRSSVKDWRHKPQAIIELKLIENRIKSSAQALSAAKEISRRIKTYIDQWEVERIHLFAAIPVSLAALITYHLNAICPIDLYYLNDERTQYTLAGTISNNL